MKLLIDTITEIISGIFGFLFEGITGLTDKDENQDSNFGNESDYLSRRNQGFAVTSDKYLSMEDSMTHLLVTAGSGVGKSTNTMVPGILHQKIASIICMDNSGELRRDTEASKLQDGYKTFTLDFNPTEFTNQTTFYNPLARIHPDDKSAIAKVTSLLVGNSTEKKDYWSIKSEEVVNLAINIILQESPEKRHLYSVLRCIESMVVDRDKMNKKIARMDEDTFRKWKLLLSNAKNTLDSILSSAISVVSWIGNNVILAKLTSRDSLNFDAFRDEKICLYIKVPLENQKLYQPLINLFFTQFFNHILSQPLPKKYDRPILVFADEFGSMHIPEYEMIISNCRKWFLGIQMLIQSESQISKIYGVDGKDIILANCSKMYMTGLDKESEDLSRILGRRTITDEKTGHTREVPLMTASQIRTMKDKAIVLPKGGRKPLLVSLKPFYKKRAFVRLTQMTKETEEEPIPIEVLLHPFTFQAKTEKITIIKTKQQ
jgi:type IV secretory pathway TraG/TraD family ATPase VirD4